jgi:hypothetical protein
MANQASWDGQSTTAGKHIPKVEATLTTGSLAIGKLAANSGVDIGDVTVNNANGVNAVMIQDGGNTITVDGTVTVGAITAGETHIGEVGGSGITIAQIPTVTAGAYSAKDAVGGLLTFANAARVSAGGGILKNVVMIDDNGQDAALELWLFKVTFTAMVDNAGWAPSEADLENLICVVNSTDGTWLDAGTPSANIIECSQRYDLTGTSMFGQLVTRGTPTFAATDDVTVKIALLRD